MSRPNEPRNAANEKHVQQMTQEETRKRQRELEDVRALLKLSEGRRFFWRVLESCSVFSASYTGVAESTFFNEGRRQTGLALLTDIMEAEPSAFLRMMQEAKGA